MVRAVHGRGWQLASPDLCVQRHLSPSEGALDHEQQLHYVFAVVPVGPSSSQSILHSYYWHLLMTGVPASVMRHWPSCSRTKLTAGGVGWAEREGMEVGGPGTVVLPNPRLSLPREGQVSQSLPDLVPDCCRRVSESICAHLDEHLWPETSVPRVSLTLWGSHPGLETGKPQLLAHLSPHAPCDPVPGQLSGPRDRSAPALRAPSPSRAVRPTLECVTYGGDLRRPHTGLPGGWRSRNGGSFQSSHQRGLSEDPLGQDSR